MENKAGVFKIKILRKGKGKKKDKRIRIGKLSPKWQ
jgi:hypothetical protein